MNLSRKLPPGKTSPTWRSVPRFFFQFFKSNGIVSCSMSFSLPTAAGALFPTPKPTLKKERENSLKKPPIPFNNFPYENREDARKAVPVHSRAPQNRSCEVRLDEQPDMAG